MMRRLVTVTMYAFTLRSLILVLSQLQYSWFHVIFAGGAMYVAMLLTDWYVSLPSLFVALLISLSHQTF